MKTAIIAVAGAGLLGLALTAPKPAQAAQVFVDLHFGIPVVTQRPRVVYEPVVVYRPRVVTPPPVVYYHPHHYYPHHYYRHHETVVERGREIRRVEGPIIEQRGPIVAPRWPR